MLPVDGDATREQEWSHGRSCPSTLGAGREITCGDATCAPGWLTDIIPRVKATLGVSYSSSRKVLEMLWYFKIKGQTVTLLEYDTSWWRLGLTSVVLPGSSLGLRKRSDELSFTHLSETLCLPCLHYTLYIAYFVVSLSGQGEQVCNPLQNHNCTFHLHLVSTIRETDHQPCLSLLRETSLDPWPGYFCSKQCRKQLGLNFLPVRSVLMMKTLCVFCLTPVCALPFMGMQ